MGKKYALKKKMRSKAPSKIKGRTSVSTPVSSKKLATKGSPPKSSGRKVKMRRVTAPTKTGQSVSVKGKRGKTIRITKK